MWPLYCCSVIHLVLGWGLFVERPLFKGKKHRRGIANHCPRLTSSQNFMHHCFPFKTFISIRNRQTRKTKLQRPSLHPQEYPANTCRLPTATTGNTYTLQRAHSTRRSRVPVHHQCHYHCTLLAAPVSHAFVANLVAAVTVHSLP